MKETKVYLAPLEGVTDSIFRNAFLDYYGGVDKVFTPFISPNSTFKFTTREFKEINPENNDVHITVPQLLTNKSEHFLWAAAEIAALGFAEINLNLGCPSGTVVAKKKGSGLLYYPEELDKFLYEIFEGIEEACRKKSAAVPAISIKTRLGKAEPEESYEILDIYNKYPISELTIHPRIQSDFYKEPVRMENFDYSIVNTDIPVIYNGDLKSVSDIKDINQKYENLAGVMLGRGVIANPELALNYKNQSETPLDTKKLKAFHDSLLEQYVDILSGEKPVLHRMKEFWVYWQTQFEGQEKVIKKIKKSNRLAEYKSIVEMLFG